MLNNTEREEWDTLYLPLKWEISSIKKSSNAMAWGYRKVKVKVKLSKAILNKHPFFKIWKEIVPYLLQWNPSYASQFNQPALYNIT